MRVVNYLMSGPAHLPYLATSLYTLRRYWQGAIHIYAWPESLKVATQLANDPRIFAHVFPRIPAYRGKNGQFLDKIKLMQGLPECANLYLDADTLIAGKIDALFGAAEEHGFVATQFNAWTTEGTVIRARLQRLRQFAKIDSEVIDQTLARIYPSVNGGIFACQPNSSILSLWYLWSWESRSIFICDECVLHLMVTKFDDDRGLVVMPGYNSSPKYTPEQERDKVRIWHGHGDCFTRPQKSLFGTQLWWRVLQVCVGENIGGIREWLPTIKHKWFTPLFEANHATLPL